MLSAKKSTILFGAMLFFGALLTSHAQQSTPANSSKSASSLIASTNEDELLEPDQAFKLKVTVKGPNTVLAELTPAAGYYMYRDRIHFTVKDASGIKIKTVKLPTGDIKTDPNFGKMETYKNPIQAEITVDRPSQVKNFTLIAAYQGCHEKLGVCYPPIDKTVTLTLP